MLEGFKEVKFYNWRDNMTPTTEKETTPKLVRVQFLKSMNPGQ